MHLILSRLNIAIRTSTICHLIAMKLNAATFLTRNNCQCIWWHRHQMQLWQFHQNNRQRASDRFTAECSMSDIIFNRQCIWWHRHQMQAFLTSTACLSHSLIAASYSFERFFYVIEKPLIGLHTYSFDQVFLEKDINHQHSIKNHFYIVNTCNLSERFQK